MYALFAHEYTFVVAPHVIYACRQRTNIFALVCRHVQTLAYTRVHTHPFLFMYALHTHLLHVSTACNRYMCVGVTHKRTNKYSYLLSGKQTCTSTHACTSMQHEHMCAWIYIAINVTARTSAAHTHFISVRSYLCIRMCVREIERAYVRAPVGVYACLRESAHACNLLCACLCACQCMNVYEHAWGCARECASVYRMCVCVCVRVCLCV